MAFNFTQSIHKDFQHYLITGSHSEGSTVLMLLSDIDIMMYGSLKLESFYITDDWNGRWPDNSDLVLLILLMQSKGVHTGYVRLKLLAKNPKYIKSEIKKQAFKYDIDGMYLSSSYSSKAQNNKIYVVTIVH